MDIEALVDNQLDLQTAARVRAAVQHDPQMHRAYNKLVAQKKLLNMWWHNQQHH